MSWAAITWLGPLFAAADPDWWRAIIFVVAIAIYAINHLISGLKKSAAGKTTRMPTMRPPQQPQPPIPAEPVAQRRQELNAELNDFLRRAAQKRDTPAPSAAPPQPSKAPRKRRLTPAPTVARVPVEEPLTARRSLSTLDTSAIEDRGAQLSHLPKIDEIEEHVEHTFNRQLGSLASAMDTATTNTPQEPSDQSADQPTTPAASLFALLRDPQSLRGAIIINEIMARPEQRW